MNYKSLIKDQDLRFKILGMLNWVPDSIMLRVQYRIKMGFWPDFKHPKRYTEKLQLYKMKYRNPVMHQCVDKFEVRKYVESKGLGHILNELYGVYNSPNEIDFTMLPNQFVVKTTDGGGGLNVIVVKDKASTDIEDIKEKLASWQKRKKVSNPGREWAYEGQYPSRIIIEKYLEDRTGGGNLSDYKLMFFNGRFRSLWVDKDRYTDHHRGFWDENLKFLSEVYSDHDTFQTPPALPDCMPEMIKVGEILSEDFPYARIDLYDIDGKIVFGEITFYPWSGYVKFTPTEFDIQLGSYFTEYGETNNRKQQKEE